jgi:hypothetical protein
MDRILNVVYMALMVYMLMYYLTLDGFNDELTQIAVHVRIQE